MNWVLPYIDQPVEFWDTVRSVLRGEPFKVYFPMPDSPIGTGRPKQPAARMSDFLRETGLQKSVLLNPVVHARPVAEMAKGLIERLRVLHGEFNVGEAVVTDPLLAFRIREALPAMQLAASTLMEIASPRQLAMLGGVFDAITPSGRIMRDIRALQRLRKAFPGRLRLMVNEGCLPGCPFRIQHFYEMNSGASRPGSLCVEALRAAPWLGLTGAWILPQHLHLFEGLFDEIKLAGRVTLQDPVKYRRVLAAYNNRSFLLPRDIGGGPATDFDVAKVTEVFYVRTLRCEGRCTSCAVCAEYYARTKRAPKKDVTNEQGS
ncbi:MAG: hypothetical protein C0404_05315 [Verrucomicrobia bacterium]|nr:hypothetical protein [Verrucomicrobiota bacterium]